MFTIYAWAWKPLFLLVITILIFYLIHLGLVHEQQIGYSKAVAEYTQKQIEAEQAARAKEQSLIAKVQEAQNEANERTQQLEKSNTALTADNQRLRNKIADIRSQLSTDSTATVTNTADTALAALGECSDRYSAMAKTADEYATQIKLLQNAWPGGQ